MGLGERPWRGMCAHRSHNSGTYWHFPGHMRASRSGITNMDMCSGLYSSTAWEKRHEKHRVQWRCSCLGNQAWQRDPSWLNTKSYHFPTNMPWVSHLTIFWIDLHEDRVINEPAPLDWASNELPHACFVTAGAKSASAICITLKETPLPNLRALASGVIKCSPNYSKQLEHHIP